MLKKECEDKKNTLKVQCGFRENYPTEVGTLKLTETITKHANIEHTCKALTVDISKVLDKVWPPGQYTTLHIEEGNRKLQVLSTTLSQMELKN